VDLFAHVLNVSVMNLSVLVVAAPPAQSASSPASALHAVQMVETAMMFEQFDKALNKRNAERSAVELVSPMKMVDVLIKLCGLQVNLPLS